jgi:Flp pilus assembly pilin Flp
MIALPPLLRNFLFDQRGVTAVEFAFVSPILLLFTIGILEFAMVFMASNVLENAVNNAARTGKTGFVGTGLSREQTILNMVSDRTKGFLDSNLLTITEVSYKDLNQLENTTNAGLGGFGNAGDIVVYTIRYPWKVITPFMDNMLNNKGTFYLESRMVAKNEPY